MSATCAYVGNVPDTLDSGRPLAPGDRVDDVDITRPHNAWLVESGRLVVLDEGEPTKLTGKALQKRAAELDIEGRGDMRADELRDVVAARETELQQQAAEEAAEEETKANGADEPGDAADPQEAQS